MRRHTMGCRAAKVATEVYRVGMDLPTFYDLRVYPKMKTIMFSMNSCVEKGWGGGVCVGGGGEGARA